MVSRMANGQTGARDPRVWDTLRHDFREFRSDMGQGNWRRSLGQTMADLEAFYLTEERRAQLAAKGRVARWLYSGAWLFKSLFLKLTPARRVLLVVALVALWMSQQGWRNGAIRVDLAVPVAILLVGLIMLELKDKLVARHELEAGRAVQMALMPEYCPRLADWDAWLFTRPANDVGGDLVDCLQLDGNRVAFMLADVAGKALPAALLMAKVQSTLRALATDVASLPDLASRTNSILCRDGLPNRFATLVYLETTAGSGTLRLVNAGHMPPVVLSPAGFHELPRGGLALGLMPSATYEEQTVDLQPGDMLFVYSDGLTEAMNEAGEFFDDERLRALFPEIQSLPAAEAGTRVIAAIDRFIGSRRPYDDLSMVILKRKQ